eukprot:CAMPEP_0181103632 /NCGR_PEP_ID=MMETSP1071-20121207/14971_1 /TAXON_ID=35127 /ORGANISM="Thalassiosira sp., Strain NH16" /LENGTH=723 /DNA_ID=CAMNT_0023186723 /DNA_START=28 /DNA_END=2199 /DNA_ORIENTATION=-
MTSFQPSTSLRHQPPTSTQNVLSTTSSLLSSSATTTGGGGGIESHPTMGKWYMREYGLGPRRSVRLVSRRSSPENRYTSVTFVTAGGTTPIGALSFSGGGGVGAGVAVGNAFQSLAVAAGPRVSLYGGRNTGGTSDFTRALKAGGAVQRRREGREDDDDEGSVDLFGGKTKKGDEKEKGAKPSTTTLDDIDADRNVSTGGLLASCASHRSDSKLIAVGTEGGTVRICDANSRATLRTFSSTKSSGGGGGGDRKAIRSVAWLRDGKRVVAGGDDGLVRVWNVGYGGGGGGGSGGADITLRGHGDRVTCVTTVSFRRDEHRTGRKGSKAKKRSRDEQRSSSSAADDDDSSSGWSQLVVSGSYDHTLRAWDVTAPDGEDKCVSIMDHGDPVQAVLVLPPVPAGVRSSSLSSSSKLDNLPMLVSAGGTTLKVWNPFNGRCLGTFGTMHAKTITALCLLDVPSDDDGDDGESDTTKRKRHIITGGLDGLLRIHSADNGDIASGSLPYLHGMQVSEPISALAASRNASRLAIGTTTGVVTVYQRRRRPGTTSQSLASSQRKGDEPRHGTFSYFARGAHERSHDPDDYLLMHQKKQRLAEYDVLLRKFRYGDALDAVLAKRQPQAVIAVIEELGKRRGLTIALSNRDEESLDAILSFTIRFIDNPQYTPHLLGVSHILCDVYGSLHGQSAAVDELFVKLREKVANECGVQRMLLRLLGQIDFVMAAAAEE